MRCQIFLWLCCFTTFWATLFIIYWISSYIIADDALFISVDSSMLDSVSHLWVLRIQRLSCMSSKWMNSCISEMNSGTHSHVFVWFPLRVKCWNNLLFEHKTVEVSHAWRNCLHSDNTQWMAWSDQAVLPWENVILTCLPVQRECLNAFSVINLFYLWVCALRSFIHTLRSFIHTMSHYVQLCHFYLRSHVSVRVALYCASVRLISNFFFFFQYAIKNIADLQ